MAGEELDITVRNMTAPRSSPFQARSTSTPPPSSRSGLVEVIREGPSSIVLDLSEVTFLDSTGLGVLITGLKRCRSAGGDLVLVTAQPNVLKVLEITGLNDVFKVHDSVEDAT